MTEPTRESRGLYPLSDQWRTGRKVGRTVYAMVGPEPSEDDVLIGVMDTPEIADAAVRGHNAELERGIPGDPEPGMRLGFWLPWLIPIGMLVFGIVEGLR